MPDIDPDEELQFSFEGENLTISFDNDLKPADDAEQVVAEEPEGRNCDKCGEYYPYGRTNLPNGGFKCWGCRH